MEAPKDHKDNRPPSPLRWILIPLAVIYSIGVVVLLFKFNPELMAQQSLLSQLSKEKIDEPIATPEINPAAQTNPLQQLSFPRKNYAQTNKNSDQIKLRHRILRAKVLTLENSSVDFKPMWSKGKNNFYAFINPQELVAYNKDFQKIWNFKTQGEKSQHIGPAIITEPYVFTVTEHGKIFSLHKESGKINWLLPLERTILGPAVLLKNHLYLPALTLEGNHFQIIKVNASTGTLAWQSEKFSQKPSSPMSIEESSGLIFFGNTSGALIALSAEDGKIKWRFEESPSPIRGAPTIIKGRLFAANDEGMSYGINIKNGKKAWEYQLKSGSSSSFTAMPTTDWIAILTDSGYMHVIDRDTGDGRWRYNTKNTKAYKTIQALRLHSTSITELELLWRYKGWVLVAPCNDTRLCFFNPKEGRIIHRINLRGTLASELMFDEEDKSFYALLESGTGPTTYFEKSDENIKLPKWSMGYFLQLKDFQKRAKALREEALAKKAEATEAPASIDP